MQKSLAKSLFINLMCMEGDEDNYTFIDYWCITLCFYFNKVNTVWVSLAVILGRTYIYCAHFWLIYRSLDRLCLKNIKGFILNLPSSIGWGMLTIPLKRRHWIAVRAIDGVFYNLDSKLKQPEVVGEAPQLRFDHFYYVP